MSAFICSDKHVATVATVYTNLIAGMNGNAKTDNKQLRDHAQMLANSLLKTNIRSVNYRYGERTRFRMVKLADADLTLNPADWVRLVQCLDYQSCERPDYNKHLCASILARFEDEAKKAGSHNSNLWSI